MSNSNSFEVPVGEPADIYSVKAQIRYCDGSGSVSLLERDNPCNDISVASLEAPVLGSNIFQVLGGGSSLVSVSLMVPELLENMHCITSMSIPMQVWGFIGGATFYSIGWLMRKYQDNRFAEQIDSLQRANSLRSLVMMLQYMPLNIVVVKDPISKGGISIFQIADFGANGPQYLVPIEDNGNGSGYSAVNLDGRIARVVRRIWGKWECSSFD